MPPRRRYAKKGRKAMRAKVNRRVMRSYNANPTFTETWSAGSITTSGSTVGGVLNSSASSIPQMADYSKLFRQFRILRNEWIFVPRATSLDPNTQEGNAFSGAPNTNNGRFVYAINDTAGQAAPTTEIEVLTDNGCKILSAVRTAPIRIRHVPVPDLSIGAPSNVFSTYMNKKRTWLNTDAAGNGGSGTAIPHGAVAYFLTMPQTNPQTVFDVYCKTTIQFKDPA